MSALSPTPQNTSGQIRLLDSIVDVCLVYGFDETCECDLVTDDGIGDDICELSMDDEIFQKDINVRFLQVIAPGRVYPERQINSKIFPRDSSPNTSGSQVEDAFAGLSPSHSNKQFNVEEFGLSWDTIENRHYFLFPERAKIYSDLNDLEPSFVPLMFTNLLAEQSYGVGLKFLRPFFIERKAKCKYCCLTPWSSSVVPSLNKKLVYLPMCCALISSKPYFKFMKEALSGFYRSMLECDELDFWSAVRDFSERIFLVPAPPPGRLSISACLPGFTSNVNIRPPRGNEALDIRLNYPFTCLGMDNVLQVLTGLLTENTLLFTSSHYPLLAYTIKCFLSYISPMEWRYVTVALVPEPLLEFLDAPLPTIFGVHSSLLNSEEVQRLDNVVTVDLDNGVVTCKALETPLPSLPQHALEVFKQRYSELVRRDYSLDETMRLSVPCADEALRNRENFDYSYDEELSKMFLELMVNLYSNVTQEMLQSRVKFEETIRLMPTEDQDFYRQVETTDMFSAFCQSRRQCTERDEFTLLAERLRRLQRASRVVPSDEAFTTSYQSTPHSSIMSLFPSASSGARQTMGVSHGSSSQNRFVTAPPSYRHRPHAPSLVGGQLTSLPSIEDRHSPNEITKCGNVTVTPLESVELELPSLCSDFIDRESFLNAVIAQLKELAENQSVKAQCLYLKAFYGICQGDMLAGLDILFDTLQRLDISLVPDKNSLQCVIGHMTPNEQDELRLKSYYKHLLRHKGRKGTSIGNSSKLMSPSTFNLDKKMPRKPLSLNDFLKLVRQNAIAEDAESATNLHRILSQGINTTISPEIFSTFYDAWKVVHQENSSVELPMFELEKAEKGVKIAESILAVSSDVKTNFGSSSTIILTTYRLLVMAAFKTHEMADLRTSIRFENISHASTFSGVRFPGIRIEKLNSKGSADRGSRSMPGPMMRRLAKHAVDTFLAFQSAVERDHWYHMIREVQVGWQLSQARRDPGVMLTANSHVILQNTINQSGLLDKYTPTQRVKLALKLLSFQSKDVSEVSKFTVDNLQYRINPCLNETERQTVESLLYIPPMELYEEEQGKLWIGLGNGRLKVYDIEAKCFECDIKITESRQGKSVRLNCLLLVGQHVWVGSHSCNIHILDAQTVCHVSQISYLEDAPKDLALNNNKSLVWGLLLKGLLLAWDPNTRTRVKKIHVPVTSICSCFTIWRDYIWVGTNRGVITIINTVTGEKDHEIFFPAGRRQTEIKHLALSSEDEVWCSVYCLPKTEDSTFIAVFDPSSKKKNMQYTDLDSRISIILPVNNTMWCGSKSGKIYIFHSQTYANEKGMPKVLTAHDDDVVRSMTMTGINLVVSGGGSNDGYAAVWKTIELP